VDRSHVHVSSSDAPAFSPPKSTSEFGEATAAAIAPSRGAGRLEIETQWSVVVAHPGMGALGEQRPLVGSQVPAVWQESLAVHVTGLDPAHAPPWHAYAWLHLLVPRHAVPLAAVGFEHVPVPGSQMPTTWQPSLALQATGLEPMHVPDWHA
jgi:hypothetical protein